MLNLKAKKITHTKTDPAFETTTIHIFRLLLIGLAFLCNPNSFQPQTAFAEIESSGTIASSILEVPSPDPEVNLAFTLYKKNDVQYFSAGVGVEERNASYPAYPLKLILVQGEKAFLAEVQISITKSDGTPLVNIPSEQVMGPWLFVQLPFGSYTISATDSHQRIITKDVQVGEGGTRVVHLRWPAI